MNFYRLHIQTRSDEVYNQVSVILNLEPTFPYDEKELKRLWIHGFEDDKEDSYIDFINVYLNILEPKFEELESVGIKRDDISVWRIYGYNQQCSMEFSPTEMKRLAENGITLCIDCFEQ